LEDICGGLLVVGPGLSGTSPANSNNTATSVAGLQIVERGRYGGKSVFPGIKRLFLTCYPTQWQRKLFGRHGNSSTTFEGGMACNVRNI